MANNYFQFKQFRVVQEKSAMKVGVDGVLLGAWTDVTNTNYILDIGTGTGLLALMLAQRTNANITAIEIEKNAAEEATCNIQNSLWKNQIAIENISFQEFVNTSEMKFDLIVSNPPFFTNSLNSQNKNRTLARHNNSLPFSELINGAAKLCSINGRFTVIIPFAEAENFITLAKHSGLYLSKSTEIKPKPSKKPNRILMEFSKKKSTAKYESLIVRTENGSDYSEMHKQLTSEYYFNLS